MKWNIDNTHSHIDFSVRHMGFSTVRGRFREFEGFLETDADNNPVNIEVDIKTESIDTGVADRDNHLRSADFFDAATNPTITFRSTSFDHKGGNRYAVTGDLTMNGITKPVTFDVEGADPITDPFGLTRAAASGSTEISRKEWDLTWNQVLEAGGVMVSDKVKLSFEVEITAEQPQEAAA